MQCSNECEEKLSVCSIPRFCCVLHLIWQSSVMNFLFWTKKSSQKFKTTRKKDAVAVATRDSQLFHGLNRIQSHRDVGDTPFLFAFTWCKQEQQEQNEAKQKDGKRVKINKNNEYNRPFYSGLNCLIYQIEYFCHPFKVWAWMRLYAVYDEQTERKKVKSVSGCFFMWKKANHKDSIKLLNHWYISSVLKLFPVFPFFSHSPTETFSHSFCSHNFFHFSDFGAYKRHLFHSLGHSLMMTMMMAYKNKMFERDHVCASVDLFVHSFIHRPHPFCVLNYV